MSVHKLVILLPLSMLVCTFLAFFVVVVFGLRLAFTHSGIYLCLSYFIPNKYSFLISVLEKINVYNVF